jgi:hypothetical protein
MPMTGRGLRSTVAAMKRTTLAVTLMLCIAVGLSACGGSGRLSAADYKNQLAAFGRQDDKVHAKVDNLPHSKTVADMKAGLAAFAAGERRLGTEVAALNPPKNAETANAALAKGFTDTATEMKQVLAALGSASSPKQALGVIGRFGPKMNGGKELDAALAKLNKLGYANAH